MAAFFAHWPVDDRPPASPGPGYPGCESSAATERCHIERRGGSVRSRDADRRRRPDSRQASDGSLPASRLMSASTLSAHATGRVRARSERLVRIGSRELQCGMHGRSVARPDSPARGDWRISGGVDESSAPAPRVQPGLTKARRRHGEVAAAQRGTLADATAEGNADRRFRGSQGQAAPCRESAAGGRTQTARNDKESEMTSQTQIHTIARQMFEQHGIEAIAQAAPHALACERKGEAEGGRRLASHRGRHEDDARPASELTDTRRNRRGTKSTRHRRIAVKACCQHAVVDEQGDSIGLQDDRRTRQ